MTELLKRMKAGGKVKPVSDLIVNEELTYGADDLPSRFSGYETLRPHAMTDEEVERWDRLSGL